MSLQRRRRPVSLASGSVENLESRLLFSDTTPPTASLSVVQNITTSNVLVQNFAVQYTDNVSINTSTLDSSDVTVSGPGGITPTVRFVSATPSSPNALVTAVYQFTPPGGQFDASDNGTYTITLGSSQVKDTSGNPVAGHVLGTFDVNIAPETVTPGNVLTINGTNAGDSITVSSDGTNFSIDINGTVTTEPVASVTGISIYPGAGDDSVNLRGSTIGASVFGGLGNDTILGSQSPDTLRGGPGSDSLSGFGGNDTLRGGEGDDTVKGAAGDDLIEPLAGGNDSMFGGAGDDTIIAVNGNNTITGGGGSDSLRGGTGNDVFFAIDAGGIDSIDGGAGADTAHVDAGDVVSNVSTVLNT